MNSPYPLPCIEAEEIELEESIQWLRIAVSVRREIEAYECLGVRCGNA